MVFESLVVSVLNHFLGPYVKNLDASQLSIGIWNGDALLKRLEIKENAFTQLNLPIRVKGGFLNKLRLKIPWKSKFTDPVIAEVEGLYLIASPLSATPYDDKKESKEAREKKQSQLKKIEEAKKREKAGSTESDDGFVAKIVTQIVKNIQITVNNIHIRYEDDVTIPGHNFAAGVTLEGLIIQSTDSNWKLGVNREEGALIYKILQLNSLCVYWDTDTQLFGDLPSSEWLKHLKARITTSTNKPAVNYILKPLSAEAKATVTTKPGQDPAIPQADVGIAVSEVAVHMDELQFRGVVNLADSLDRMSVNARYRKYKPAVKLKDNPKLWWKYAIASVIEEHVKRKTQMWSPKHVRQRWKLFENYVEKYKQKVLASSPSKDLLSQLEQLEDQLEIGNIVVARNEAELRASKETKAKERRAAEAKASGGWFSGWFTTPAPDKDKDEPPVIPSDEEMEAERQSLYKAIGYAQGKAIEPFSKEYIAHKLKFVLTKVTLELYNDNKRAAMLQVLRVETAIAHRPSAKGISVSAMVGDITASGIDDNSQPVIVESTSMSKGSKDVFVDVKFEMNPLDIVAEESIRLIANVKPLRITYNATTIEHVIHIFKVPKDVRLQQVSSSTAQTLKQLRTQTRTGLQHAIKQKRVYDISIKVESPHVIVPENGLLRSSSSVLLVDLGCLAITSDSKQLLPSEESIMNATVEELSKAFYDNFNVKLDSVKVIVAGKGDDYEKARASQQSKLNVLENIAINLELKKSLLPKDTRLPEFIVEGALPDLHLSLSDKKLEQIAKIVLSLPPPPPVMEVDPNAVKIKGHDLMAESPSDVDMDSLIHHTVSMATEVSKATGDDESSDDYATASEGEDEDANSKDTADSGRSPQSHPTGTELLLKVELGKIGISFDHWQEASEAVGEDVRVLSLEISAIKAEYRKQTFDDVATVTVANISILSHLLDDTPRPFLMSDAVDNNFISVNYCQAKETGPEFKTRYQSTKQSITASLSLLTVNVHSETLPKLIDIFQSMGDNMTAMLKEREDRIGTSTQRRIQTPPLTREAKVDKEDISQVVVPDTGSKKSSTRKGVILLHFIGKFGGFAVALDSSGQEHKLLVASIKGVDTDVKIDDSKIIVEASVSDMVIEDPSSSTPYNKIVSKSDQSKYIIDAMVVVYKDPIEGEAIADLERANLSVKATVAKLQVMVIFQFVKKIIDFVTNLQINRKLLQSAGNAASNQVSKAANALRERNTSRVKLDIIINAPLIVLPTNTANDSTDIFVINLGQLVANNKFITGSQYNNEVDPSELQSSTGQPAIMDRLSVNITSVKFHRVKSFDSIEQMSEKKVLIKLLQCSAEVTRNLSPWCKALPLIDVSVQLDTIYVYFTPNVYHAIMAVMDSAKILSVPTTSGDSGTKDDKKEITESGDDKIKDVEPVDNQSVTEGKIIARCSANGVSLLINLEEEKSLAAVKVKGLSVDATMADATITVVARLKEVNVSNLFYHSLFPLVVYSEDKDETVFVKVVLHQDMASQQHLDPEIAITAKVQQINVVVLYQFIMAVRDLVDQLEISRRPVTQEKEQPATGMAVDSTRSNDKKIKLDIDINAPNILLPLNSLRREGFIIDLGQVKISNSFQVIPETSSMKTKGILDIITIDLSRLTINRFVMGNLLCKYLCLLNPLKAEIVVQRSLSSWHKDVPLADVRLYVHPVKASISDNDVSMAMELLQLNFGEAETAAMVTLDDIIAEEEAFEAEKETLSSSEVVTNSDTTDTEETHCVFAVSVLMDSFDVRLYHKTLPFKISKIHSWKRDESMALASVGLNTLKAKFNLHAHEMMELDLSLLGLLLEDSREGKDDRISMMVHNHRVTHPSKPAADVEEDTMIVLKVTKDKWNRLTVNAKLNYLQVLLDIKFIFALLDFAKRGLMVDRQKSSVDKLSDQSTVQQKEESTTELTLNVDIVLNEPRIALLEDASKPNSRAIVLQSYFQLIYNTTESSKKLAFIGRDLSIILTRYATITQAHSTIMAPCTIDLSLEDSTGKTEGYLEIIESVKIIISPATVRLLLYVVRSIPKPEDTGDIGQNIPPSFWNAKPLDKKKWYFTAADTLFDVQDIIGSSVDVPKFITPPKKENMTVTLKQLQIVFEKELLEEGRTIPLILFSGEPPDATRKLEDSSVDKEPSVYDHPVYIEVSNWSRNLSATARIQFRGSYYNERLDVIEPLLEPVEKEDFTYRLWQLKIEALRMIDVTKFLDTESRRRSKSFSQPGRLKSFDEHIIYPSSLPPLLSLTISSEHTLQLTLTKTSLEILMELQKSYLDISSEEYDSTDFTEHPHQAAYIITNKLGADCGVTIVPKGNLKVATGEKVAEVKHKGSVPLTYKDFTKQMSIYDGMDCIVQQPDIVEITVKGFAALKISLTDNKLCYYGLTPVTEEQPVIKYGLMVEIDRHKETKRVTLKSPITICNHLSVSCELYTSDIPDPKKSNELAKLDQIQPDQSISIPLIIAHKGYVFVKPTQKKLYVSSKGIHRSDINSHYFNLSCQPYGEGEEYFYIRVKPMADQSMKAYKLTAGDMERRPHHVLHLYYPVLFYNMLPIAVTTNTTNKKVELQAGEHHSYSNINVTKQQTFTIAFSDSGHTWKGSVNVWDKMKSDDIVEFSTDDKVDGKPLQQVFSVSTNQDSGYLKVSFYAKYWITNKTDRTLIYTGHELMHIAHPIEDEMKFFSMKKKDFKDSEFIVRMRLPNKEYTTWSRVIPLVAAGSAGTLKVQHNKRDYELGIKVQILSFGLSMIITITPLYVLKNDTTHSVVVQEVGQNDTITLAPKTTTPFWPVNTQSCKLTISINDNAHKTKPFSIVNTNSVLLRTEGKATSAVVMDVQVTEICKIVSFKPLFSGAIPFVMINHFSHQTIVFRQNIEGGSDEYQLAPGQSTVYTWSDPCKKREIVWWLLSKQEAKNTMEIKTSSGKFEVQDVKPDTGSSVDTAGTDEADDESIDRVKGDRRKFSLTSKVKKLANKTKYSLKAKKRQESIEADKGGYWVSFLDGLQRVIMFTPDAYVYKIAQRPSLIERTNTSVTADLLAIGLSLVNDIDSKEVAYLGLTGSEIVWEYEKKKNRWVAVSLEDVDKLERFHEKYKSQPDGPEKMKFPIMVDKDMGANFEDMTLTIDKKTHKLRRTFYEGFWAHIELSNSETELSARIGRIQLDNQLFNPIFDNVLHGVPPLNAVARKHPPKPFFEVSSVIGATELSGARQYPYFELLIQKMAFNLDLNFLFALMDMFTVFILKEENTSELKLIERSRDELKLSLENVVMHTTASQVLPNYFGAFKIHPLSIVLSLNFDYTASDQERYWYFGPLFNMLKSFGTSFVTADDIDLKLSLFVVENKILTQQQMIEKIKQHYVQGGIGQAYKIVLGLDVLGNPVGFVTGLASGTKGLFYEPFEGALLGPEEFLQGLGYGVHDFVGATIGGVADSISRITDTAGSATVSLILSDEEKRKREASRRGTSMLGGLGHFASDVLGGVTGVVSKPVEGAKEHGIAGFFSGAGKGVAGFFLRPIGGTFDLLNVTFDNVKKVTTRGDYEVSQLRPSRYIGVDGVVQIYSFHLANGNAAFVGLNKFGDTDTYLNHVVTKRKPFTLLIVTTRRFMLISKSSLTGGWQVEHSAIEFSEMLSAVKVEDKSIVASLAIGKESGFQGFAGRIGRGISGNTKAKTKKMDFPNKETATEAAQIINNALNAEL